MALTPWDLVDHLDQAGLLAPPESSPWPTLDAHAQDAYLIDWNRLFREDQDWALDDQDLIRNIDRNLGVGPPETDESDGVASRRADVCAWYQPIHFHGLGWGIFILEDCLKMIAADIARWLPANSAPPRWLLVGDLLRAAFGTLFLHEAYHHRTECFSFRTWTVDGVGRYHPYWGSVYAPTVKSPGALEEALANASSFQRLDEPAHRPFDRDVARAAKDYLTWRFPLDPPGYRDATKYVRRGAIWDGGENQLKEQVATARIAMPARAADRWAFAPNMNESYFGIKSNIWSVVPKGTAPALPTSRSTVQRPRKIL